MENYEELKRKYLDSRQECEEYFSTIQVQAEYIRQLESEIENLKSANSIDPDALLTIR